MAGWVDVDRVVDSLVELTEEFDRMVRDSPSEEMVERVRRWKNRVVRLLRSSVNEDEATKYEKISMRFDSLVMKSFEAMLQRHRSSLLVLTEEIVQHPSDFFSADTYVAVRPKIVRIFVSHAAGDRPIAEFIRDELIERRTGTDVFLASRPGHIRTGEEWWQTIQRELRESDAYVVLLTPSSVARPWIPFETGAAWMTGRTLLTVAAGIPTKGEIPNPLGFFQVNSLEVPEEAEAFFVDVGASTEDIAPFCDSVKELSGRVREEQEKLRRNGENDAVALLAERDRLASQVQDLQTALDYGFQVPVRLETLKQYAPSVAATQIEQWFDELVARAKEGDAHAKTEIPAVASALMNAMADLGASPGRAQATAKIETAMNQLGLPWARPLQSKG